MLQYSPVKQKMQYWGRGIVSPRGEGAWAFTETLWPDWSTVRAKLEIGCSVKYTVLSREQKVSDFNASKLPHQ
jgi:hypothetical protein